jgi:hypothetical protein
MAGVFESRLMARQITGTRMLNELEASAVNFNARDRVDPPIPDLGGELSPIWRPSLWRSPPHPG